MMPFLLSHFSPGDKIEQKAEQDLEVPLGKLRANGLEFDDILSFKQAIERER